MTAFEERLMADLKSAMRDGDTTRREAIRMLRAAILNEELELQRQALEALQASSDQPLPEDQAVPRRSLTDDETLRLFQRLVKRHHDSIEQFQRGGRSDLVAHEEAQLAIIQGYLPQQMGRDEIEALVRSVIAETGATSRRDMGKVMPRLTQELRGRADPREVNRVVQELLGA
jgi:uncharacterized protein YqeY